MKRLFITVIGVLILLCGCTKSPTTALKLPQSYVTETEITAGDTVYGAVLSRFADGYWQIELCSPAAVKGLIFTVSGENTDVSFDGLKFTFDTNRFPVGSVVSSAIDCLDRLAAQELDVIVGEEQCLASGSLGEEDFTLTLSKTKVPQKLELVDSGMTVEFKTFDIVEFES